MGQTNRDWSPLTHQEDQMLKEHDVVVLMADAPEDGLKAGDVGTIIAVARARRGVRRGSRGARRVDSRNSGCAPGPGASGVRRRNQTRRHQNAPAASRLRCDARGAGVVPEAGGRRRGRLRVGVSGASRRRGAMAGRGALTTSGRGNCSGIRRLRGPTEHAATRCCFWSTRPSTRRGGVPRRRTLSVNSARRSSRPTGAGGRPTTGRGNSLAIPSYRSRMRAWGRGGTSRPSNGR